MIPSDAQWRRALRCSSSGSSCVELTLAKNSCYVRNSRNVCRMLHFSGAAWRVFLDLTKLTEPPR
ncbi:DUF397 domain-containing protein [Actinocrispum wychmicini]|uniref:DUF397 domain-containing protein n=1 Tax=Actinocrispum wychmicini TaxID=1213861 RepID=UPI0010505326